MTYKKWYKEHVAVADKKKTDIIKLTDAQQYAINNYMSFGAYTLNEKLRTGQRLTDEEAKRVKVLEQALEKCPKYEGRLSRSLSFYDEDALKSFIKEHTKNTMITEESFTSMTKGTENLYNPEGHILMEEL